MRQELFHHANRAAQIGFNLSSDVFEASSLVVNIDLTHEACVVDQNVERGKLLDDCVSQGPDPVFKPLCLHHHHLAVVGAERNSRHALKGREQMDREFS